MSAIVVESGAITSLRLQELAARYEQLKCLEKAIESELEELSAEIKAEISATGRDRVHCDAGSFSLSSSRSRVVSFKRAWAAVWEFISECDPADRQRVRSEFEECVTVSVGGIDRLIRASKSAPDFQEALRESIGESEKLSETLRFTRSK